MKARGMVMAGSGKRATRARGMPVFSFGVA